MEENTVMIYLLAHTLQLPTLTNTQFELGNGKSKRCGYTVDRILKLSESDVITECQGIQ